MACVKFLFKNTNANWPVLPKPGGRHGGWCFPRASDAAVM